MLIMVALSVGVVVGSAINPGGVSAGPARLVLGEGNGTERGAAPESGASDSEVALGAPSGSSPAPAPTSPAPPAPTADAPVAAASAPVVEPSVPLDEAPLASPEVPAGEQEEGADVVALEGTVVQMNPAARGYALATTEGDIAAVHAGKLPAVGDQLSVKARQLANGTRSERSRKDEGSSRAAKLRGTVTFVDSDQRSYVVSARGASILVQAPDGTRELPALRDLVTVTATLEEAKPEPESRRTLLLLREASLEIEGSASGPVEMHGTIEKVDETGRRVTLSADSVRASERDVEIVVPRAIVIERLKRGTVIVATVEIAEDGAYSLTGVSQDNGPKAADDERGFQGDQEPL